jgi:membrane associated rhomboid family serine protease
MHSLARATVAAYVIGSTPDPRVSRSSQPILNVPTIVAAIVALLVLVHAVRALVNEWTDVEILLWLAFIPARYAGLQTRMPLPGGEAADLWTFVTYAFLHGDYVHLLINLVWFLAFGTAVARRFGSLRFLAFFAVTSAAGATAHLVTHWGELAPLVGASAAISGMMGAAMRFAFETGGPLGLLRDGSEQSYRVPAAPLLRALRHPQVFVFLAVWIVINIVFGLGVPPELVGNGTIAWEAHFGGLLAGLLLFPLFDPVEPAE